jgi:hypothetical protein
VPARKWRKIYRRILGDDVIPSKLKRIERVKEIQMVRELAEVGA